MPNLAGAISSLLMSLPLIAVPCLAVFGLPSIGPATAEAEADDSIELGPASPLGEAALGAAVDQPPTPATDRVASSGSDVAPMTIGDSPFEIHDSTSHGARADRQGIARTSDRRGATANHAIGIGDEPASPAASPAATAAAPGGATPSTENPFADVQAPAADRVATSEVAPAEKGSTTNPGGSWERIVAQLNAHGIHEFYLTNGEVPGEFYFTCSITRGDNAVQRFEAEGASPLVAARTVLAEVQAWQGTH